MKTQQVTQYICELCGAVYSSSREAQQCESRPIIEDKGVKPGDKVQVLSGDGAGEIATVESIFVYDKSWGHYEWDKYWHTIGLWVELQVGSRQLCFDDYRKEA